MNFIKYVPVDLGSETKHFYKYYDYHPELFPPVVDAQYIVKLKNGKYAIAEWKYIAYDITAKNRKIYKFQPYPYSSTEAGDSQVIAWAKIEE